MTKTSIVNIEKKSIKEIYALIEDKISLINFFAKKHEREPRSISNNWFSGFFAVPKTLRESVKNDMIDFYNNPSKFKETA